MAKNQPATDKVEELEVKPAADQLAEANAQAKMADKGPAPDMSNAKEVVDLGGGTVMHKF